MNVMYRQQLEAQKILNTQEKTHELWGDGSSLEERFQKLIQLTQYEGGRWLRVSGLENTQGQLLCSLKRYLLDLVNEDGEAICCIGLGAVFTAPEVRKQGLAAQLITQVLKEARSAGIACAVLYSDINPSYYEQFGFKQLPAKNYTFQTAIEVDPLPPFEIRLASQNDLPWLVQCYEKSWPKGVLRIHRSLEGWKFYRLLNAGPDLSDWILSENGVDLGYFTAVKKKDRLWIEEYALDQDRCGEGADVLSLNPRVWSTVRQLAQQYDLHQVKGWLNPRQHPPECHVEDRQKAIPMVLDLTKLKEGVQPLIPCRFDLSKFILEQAVMGSMDHF